MEQNNRLQYLNEQVDIAEKTLSNLNQLIDQRKSELEKAEKTVKEFISMQDETLINKLSQVEESLADPQQGLAYIYEELKLKENNLLEIKKDVDGYMQVIESKEKEIYDIERDIEIQKQKNEELYQLVLSTLIGSIRSNADMIKQRAELVDIRAKRLDVEQKSLKDKIASFRALQSEILTNNRKQNE